MSKWFRRCAISRRIEQNRRPRCSIVFLAFLGEERGLLGSRYYVRHPLFPIAKSVADINLEVVGQTDSSKGRQLVR